MIRLTDRQQEILDLIRRNIRETGFPPTRAEIAQAMGFRSPNAAEDHLRALERKGVLDIAAGSSRGIRILTEEVAQPAAAALAQFTLPLVGRVAAGAPILAEEHIERTLAVDPGLFSAKPDYLLKVRGMSMRDAGIVDGDLLAVKRVSEARNGQIIVARISAEVTVKRWQKHGNRIELLPENPDFEPIVVDRSTEGFAIEGLAVGLLRGSIH
jgi:repressor LexA